MTSHKWKMPTWMKKYHKYIILSNELEINEPSRESFVTEIEYFYNEENENPKTKQYEFINLLESDRVKIQVKLLENLQVKGLLK